MTAIQPVDQTIFGDTKGNCFAACLATLLGLSIDSVPNFCADYPDDWWDRLQLWLHEWGFYAIEVSVVDDGVPLNLNMPPVHCIVTGKSPRGDFNHCIVGVVRGGRVEYIHDPHGDRSFLDGQPRWVLFLGALNRG